MRTITLTRGNHLSGSLPTRHGLPGLDTPGLTTSDLAGHGRFWFFWAATFHGHTLWIFFSLGASFLSVFKPWTAGSRGQPGKDLLNTCGTRPLSVAVTSAMRLNLACRTPRWTLSEPRTYPTGLFCYPLASEAQKNAAKQPTMEICETRQIVRTTLASPLTKANSHTVLGRIYPRLPCPVSERNHCHQSAFFLFFCLFCTAIVIAVQVSEKEPASAEPGHSTERQCFSDEKLSHLSGLSVSSRARSISRMGYLPFYSLFPPHGLGPGKTRGRLVVHLAFRRPRNSTPCLAFFHCLVGDPPNLDRFSAQAQPTLLTTTLPRKTPTEKPRTLDPALLSPASFLEHTRLEGPTPNTCLVCNVSFQTNSGLESHAKDAGHSAFLCACDTAFRRLSTLARHINANTGPGYQCELCGDRTLPRIDKLYDHLRDGHKVSPTVLDQHRNKALGRARKASRPTKPALAPAPVATTQVAPSGGFGPSWSSAGQMNGMAGRHTMNAGPSSLNGINPAHLTVRFPNATMIPRQGSRGSGRG